MRTGAILSLALVSALMGSQVMAQSDSPGPGPGPGFGQGPGAGNNWRMGFGMMGWGAGPMGRGGGAGRFGIIDLNDDGRISDEEAAAAALDVFVAMDADDDGELTREEYMAVRMGAGPGWNPTRRAQMEERKAARFDEMDADKNGTVTRGEFLDAAKAHHAAADNDGDGSVSPWEHRRRNWY
ncbi:MAG: hypothetical protein Tsb0019_20460 [Roseibium sp.]